MTEAGGAFTLTVLRSGDASAEAAVRFRTANGTSLVDFDYTEATGLLVFAAGVILVLLFGLVALYQLPYQLAPRIEKPVVSVRTFWAGASPYEVERDIIEVQEKALKGLPNLVHMESDSRDNMGNISLTFELGTGHR